MTSAAELFYNRRSRSDVRILNREGRVVPEHSFSSHPLRRRHFHEEPEAIVSNNSSPPRSGTGNNITGRVNRLTGIINSQGNERLPGAVLAARARLLERLQGASLLGSRQNTRGLSTVWDEFAGDDDSEDSETETNRDWIESNIRLIDLAAEENPALSFQNASKKKPPGLSREAIFSLPQDFFKDGEEIDRAKTVSFDCSICLERYGEGDRLFCLPCNHRFHPACLEPWLRTCGDCPYCRASI